MLRNLLSFDNCSSVNEIEIKFLNISKALFEKYVIFNKLTKKYYLITNIELFNDYPEADASDPFIHKHTQQTSTATWYIHQKNESGTLMVPKLTGISIACGKESKYYASITIESLIEIGDSLDLKITKKDFVKNSIKGIAKVVQALILRNIHTMTNRGWLADEKELLLKVNNTSIFDENSILCLIENDNIALFSDAIELNQDKRDSVQKLKGKKKQNSLSLPLSFPNYKAKNYMYRTFITFSQTAEEIQIKKIKEISKKYKN